MRVRESYPRWVRPVAHLVLLPFSGGFCSPSEGKAQRGLANHPTFDPRRFFLIIGYADSFVGLTHTTRLLFWLLIAGNGTTHRRTRPALQGRIRFQCGRTCTSRRRPCAVRCPRAVAARPALQL